MAEFTKEEQIQAIYDLKVGHTLGHADIAMLKSMARQLLAGLGQEPVAWVMKDDLADADIISTPAYPAFADAITKTIGELIPLYAAPQLPQPAVDELLKEHLRMVECMLVEYREGNSGHAKEWIRHISNSSDKFEEKHSLSPWLWARSHCRAAMIQGAEPVLKEKLSGQD